MPQRLDLIRVIVEQLADMKRTRDRFLLTVSIPPNLEQEQKAELMDNNIKSVESYAAFLMRLELEEFNAPSYGHAKKRKKRSRSK